MAETLPAIFFGHGNPMNALMDNSYTKGWRRMGEQTPVPRAILSISAHWFVPETRVTISTTPRTIHDFGGFPRQLYQVQYPAPGDPEPDGLSVVCRLGSWRRSCSRVNDASARADSERFPVPGCMWPSPASLPGGA
jgi:hypothetical protein